MGGLSWLFAKDACKEGDKLKMTVIKHLLGK